MLEGNETLAIATETAYRLCESPKSWGDLCVSSSSPPSFSSTWCPNIKSRYYCSLTNGYLYYLDTSVPSSPSPDIINPSSYPSPPEPLYEILFQSFSSLSEKATPETARHVSLHWDKMKLIPGRPGEVLFLLGITQTLYYSAFPGSSSPLASTLSRSSPGYAFGTPVIEIAHHDGRITSLEVSSCGQMLATGDEHGFVKLMMICRPESLRHTIDQTLPRDTAEKLSFECIDEEVRAHGLRAHLGPIFSMAWLNISQATKQSQAFERSTSSPESRAPWLYSDTEKAYFYLVTGSNDRYVRVWSILWARQGIEVTPLTQFDLISAPVLALSSLSLTRPVPRSRLSPLRLSAPTPSPMVHLLAASTESGLVYLWRLPSSSHTQQLPALHSPVSPVSIIHSSKFPLVNLALSVLREDDQPSLSLLVIASDVQGTVRIHLSPLVSSLFDLSQPQSQHQPSAEGEVLLFSLQGQASFGSPVISCRFVDRSHGSSGGGGGRGEEEGTEATTGSELSVFLLSGEMKIYPVRDLLRSSRQPSLQRRDQEQGKGEGEQGLYQDSDLSDCPEPSSAELLPLEGRHTDREQELDLEDSMLMSPAPPPVPIPAPNARRAGSRVGASSPLKSPQKRGSSSAKGATPAPVGSVGRTAAVVPSEFSEPSLHTSRTLASYLQTHPSVNEMDDLSVATIDTTTTDRQQRANEIVNLSAQRQRYQEELLPNFSESEIERRLPQKVSLRPQIDKRWKNKLQTSQPSEEALALVTPQDPTIHLNFVSKPLASLSAASVRLAPSSSDLPHGHAFCFDVNLNQIFGEISVSDAWKEAQAAASRRRSRTAKTPLDRRDLSLSFSPFATPLGSFPMAQFNAN